MDDKPLKITSYAVKTYKDLSGYASSKINRVKQRMTRDFHNSINIKSIGNRNQFKHCQDGYIFYYGAYPKEIVIYYVFEYKQLDWKIIDVRTTPSTKEHIAVSLLYGFIQMNNEEFLYNKRNKVLSVVDKYIIVGTRDADIRNVFYKINEVIPMSDKDKLREIIAEIKDSYCMTDDEYFNILSQLEVDIHEHTLAEENSSDYNSDLMEKMDLLPEERIYQDVLNGNLKRFPFRFWSDDILGSHYDSAAICTRYMFEKVLKWDFFDIYNKVTIGTFQENKLGGMYSKVFDSNLFYAIDNAYPNKFKPFYFKKYNSDWYWSLHHEGKQHVLATKEYLLEQLGLDGIRINENNLLSYDWYLIMKKYNLLGIITSTYQENLADFFKDFFGVEYDIGKIESYKYRFRLASGRVKIHR